MTLSARKLVYHAHIGSHINYGLAIWGNSLQKGQLNKLQSIQNECLKLIATKTQINNANLNKELNILTIGQLIKLANYKFGYKLVHGDPPEKTVSLYYSDSKNKSLKKLHKYNMRNKNIPNTPKTNKTNSIS